MADTSVARKLTAILYADVEGYSRLTGADEVSTHKQLTAGLDLISARIKAAGGRVVHYAGDAVLAEVASVVAAVEAAVGIQRQLEQDSAEVSADKRLQFRIGINLGEVIVDRDEIYGDGVNVAARLESLADEGGICVSGAVFEQVKGKLDVGFQDMGSQEVKNIAEPVRVYRVMLDPMLAGETIGNTSKVRNKPTLISAAVLLAVIVGGGIWWWQQGPPKFPPIVPEKSVAAPPANHLTAGQTDIRSPAQPDKPSIAVLPFQNLSDDPEQVYFADGMAEDIITDLSKISGLFVIARHSSFQYRGKSMDLKKVGRELGVKYVLEGSVRRAGDAMRINAQLVDVTTGGHLWAERYDGALTDVFALQDAVIRKIVSALTVNLTNKEEARLAHKYTNNAAAYNAFLKGWDYYQRYSADDFVKAIPFFEKAVQLDPNYGRAYAALASLYWESVRQGDSWTSKVSPGTTNFVSFTNSRINADKYLDLAMRNPSPLAHRVASAISLDYRQFDDAITEAGQAVTLDPNDPDGYVAMAWSMIFNGRPQDALAAIERAMRLDPQNSGAYMYVLGMARFGLGQYEDALTALRRAQEKNPEYLDVNVPLAAVYAHLGHAEEARIALKRLTGVWRNFMKDVDGFMSWWPFKRETDIRRFGGGLVKAGICCEEILEQYIEHVRRGGTLE